MNHLRLGNAIAVMALGAGLMFATAPQAAADARSACQHRVEKARERYRHEVHEHGRNSRAAERAKAKLNSEWDHCWRMAHSWYDPDRREWRTDRDWDRNYDWDHDRDEHR
jgi:hypothetical protein